MECGSPCSVRMANFWLRMNTSGKRELSFDFALSILSMTFATVGSVGGGFVVNDKTKGWLNVYPS